MSDDNFVGGPLNEPEMPSEDVLSSLKKELENLRNENNSLRTVEWAGTRTACTSCKNLFKPEKQTGMCVPQRECTTCTKYFAMERELEKTKEALRISEVKCDELEDKLMNAFALEPGCHLDVSKCPTWYDSCHCTSEALREALEKLNGRSS